MNKRDRHRAQQLHDYLLACAAYFERCAERRDSYRPTALDQKLASIVGQVLPSVGDYVLRDAERARALAAELLVEMEAEDGDPESWATDIYGGRPNAYEYPFPSKADPPPKYPRWLARIFSG